MELLHGAALLSMRSGTFRTKAVSGKVSVLKPETPRFVGISDIGFWQVYQAKGYPWEDESAAYYRERSPLNYASRVTTPTLFIHPENDLRCPIEQTEQFYMALKMMGKVPVEFVRTPSSWHVGTSKPSQYLTYWEKMVAWFLKYVEIRAEEYE